MTDTSTTFGVRLVTEVPRLLRSTAGLRFSAI
jgi:hypothetical protein